MTTTRRFPARALAVALSITTVFTLYATRPASATAAVRARFFGAEWVNPVTGAVNPDKVILSWFGVTNFAAAIGGHVVLLDAWIPRGEYSGYVPTSVNELASLKPEAIFLGHGHFDHAADAAEIAAKSGATVIGTAEHCTQAKRQALPVVIGCTAVFEAGAPIGSVATPSVLSGVDVKVIKHLHSAAEPHDPEDLRGPAAPPPDANAIVHHPPSPEDTAHLGSHLGDQEAGTILWRFGIGDFSMVWHDSSGPLKENNPEVFGIFESELRPVDVQVGAIMGFNQVTNNLRDPRMYIDAMAPKVYVPSHHDNWAPPITTRGENYEPVLRAELDRMPAGTRPLVRFISDPQDYVRPEVLTFDVNAPFWG